MKCDTCHWKMSSGRCLRDQSPNSCSEYMMNPDLRRAMERQESERRERREREELERREKERQEWLKTDEGKKWQAEENRKKEEERLAKERKEREHQEWLKTEDGQKWQAEENEKKEQERQLRLKEEAEENRKNKEYERKERRWKIGRIAALSLAVFSIIMVIVSDVVDPETLRGDIKLTIFMIIPFFIIIPFAVVYFSEGIIKRIIFFIAGFGFALFLLGISSNYPNDAKAPFYTIISIGLIISHVLAMINYRDKF
ncbi:MAG: hypothetical protein FWD47_14640 [Treponema sp.]|nr:hypothetical protein [Treponema sp.]